MTFGNLSLLGMIGFAFAVLLGVMLLSAVIWSLVDWLLVSPTRQPTPHETLSDEVRRDLYLAIHGDIRTRPRAWDRIADDAKAVGLDHTKYDTWASVAEATRKAKARAGL